MSGIIRALLIRGMLAGLVAGVAAFTFATVAGEPWVREAIAYEDATSASEAHHDVGGTVVSRTVQSTAGLLTGTAVAAIALGGLFALAYAFALGRVGPRSPRPLAVALMAGAVVSVAVVPFFKYPANPPGVGDPDTIGRRTVLYLALIAVALAGGALRRRRTPPAPAEPRPVHRDDARRHRVVGAGRARLRRAPRRPAGPDRLPR